MMNQDIINEIKNQDYSDIVEKIERFLIEEIEKNNAKRNNPRIKWGDRLSSDSLHL